MQTAALSRRLRYCIAACGPHAGKRRASASLRITHVHVGRPARRCAPGALRPEVASEVARPSMAAHFGYIVGARGLLFTASATPRPRLRVLRARTAACALRAHARFGQVVGCAWGALRSLRLLLRPRAGQQGGGEVASSNEPDPENLSSVPGADTRSRLKPNRTTGMRKTACPA